MSEVFYRTYKEKTFKIDSEPKQAFKGNAVQGQIHPDKAVYVKLNI